MNAILVWGVLILALPAIADDTHVNVSSFNMDSLQSEPLPPEIPEISIAGEIELGNVEDSDMGSQFNSWDLRDFAHFPSNEAGSNSNPSQNFSNGIPFLSIKWHF